MKLFYKIFTVYLIVTFLLVATVFAILRYTAIRHFKEVEAIIIDEVMNTLAYELAMDYQKHGSWDRFREEPKAFYRFVKKIRKNNHLIIRNNRFPRPPDQSEKPFPPPFVRISLFDAERVKIAGRTSDLDAPSLKYRPIHTGDTVVGFIGVKTPKRRPPKPSLKARLSALYTIGIILFLMAGIVSYFLSRHILSPVDKLTRGTNALANFKFHTRIKVNTKDELGRLASDFNRMAGTLERYETMRKQWMLDISHELRTPLSILRGEIEALQDGIRLLTRPRIDSLHAEVVYLEKLVDNLHQLSLADTDGLVLNTRMTKPVVLLKSVLTLFKPRLNEKDLNLDVHLDQIDVALSADEAKLRQLFTNIIENNIKYTQQPGTITVWDKIEDQALVIGIEDTGPGVPPASLERIFDRLFRLDASRSRDKEGSGLGLSICKAITRAHGGDITASLTEKSGLRITIKIPLIEK